MTQATVLVEPIPPPYASKALTSAHRGILMFTIVLFAINLAVLSLATAWALILSFRNAAGLGLLVLFSGILAVLYGSRILANAVYRLWNRHVYQTACRQFESRPDFIVAPQDPEAIFVEVIPRKHWCRPLMQSLLEGPSDVGFLRIDAQRRALLFEGDKERYVVLAEAILSCEVEQMQPRKYVFLGEKRTRNNPYFSVVLRASNSDGCWEAPLSVRYDPHGLFVGSSYEARARELKERIMTVTG